MLTETFETKLMCGLLADRQWQPSQIMEKLAKKSWTGMCLTLLVMYAPAYGLSENIQNQAAPLALQITPGQHECAIRHVSGQGPVDITVRYMLASGQFQIIGVPPAD